MLSSTNTDSAKAILVPIVLLITAVVWAWLARPSLYFTLATQASARLNGISISAMELSDHDIRILVGDGSEPILLLHDFTSSKESWLPLAKQLPERYRVIAPDLPGMAASSRRSDANYDIERQATRMAELIRKLDIGQMHIVGLGIGGEIAADVAARFPDRILTVTLIAPTGIATPVPSLFDTERSEKNNPWLPVSEDDFVQLQNRYLYATPPEMSRPELSFRSKQNIQFRRFSQKILSEVESVISRLSSSLPKIAVPTQILWCDGDQLRNSSGASLTQALLPAASVKQLSNCGHMLPEEDPQRLAYLIDSYINAPELNTAK